MSRWRFGSPCLLIPDCDEDQELGRQGPLDRVDNLGNSQASKEGLGAISRNQKYVSLKSLLQLQPHKNASPSSHYGNFISAKHDIPQAKCPDASYSGGPDREQQQLQENKGPILKGDECSDINLGEESSPSRSGLKTSLAAAISPNLDTLTVKNSETLHMPQSQPDEALSLISLGKRTTPGICFSDGGRSHSSHPTDPGSSNTTHPAVLGNDPFSYSNPSECDPGAQQLVGQVMGHPPTSHTSSWKTSPALTSEPILSLLKAIKDEVCDGSTECIVYYVDIFTLCLSHTQLCR